MKLRLSNNWGFLVLLAGVILFIASCIIAANSPGWNMPQQIFPVHGMMNFVILTTPA